MGKDYEPIPNYPHSRLYHYHRDEINLTNLVEEGRRKGSEKSVPLEVGIQVGVEFDVIAENEYGFYEGFYLIVEITEIRSGKFLGKIIDLPNSHKHDFDEIWFEEDNIIKIWGPLNWKIEHEYVYVSERVFMGEEVGYFYYYFDNENLLHDPLQFYALSERDVPKADIIIDKMRLKDLVALNPDVVEFLEGGSTYGVFKEDNGQFKRLSEQDHENGLDRSVYLRSVELQDED